MSLGIGGAGSKLAVRLDPNATIVNVSESELGKINGGHHILAVVHAARGQLRGSRKSPEIGHDAFLSIKRELMHLIRSDIVFCSTGGGTGNGITSGILRELAALDDVPLADKTTFALILPYAQLEPAEYVVNTVNFLQGPLSDAIDSGNTGNIFLFSNLRKFKLRLSEEAFNAEIIDSLNTFMSIPEKGEKFRLLDGHIDQEDFSLFLSKPYFNHFMSFNLDASKSFADQLQANTNALLLPPDNPIEALFLLEVPEGYDYTVFYDILEHFAPASVLPVYSVVENPWCEQPLITIATLYSRKPDELVTDFNRHSEAHARARVRKSLEQQVVLPKLQVNLEDEAKLAAKQSGATENDVLAILRRLGKL